MACTVKVAVAPTATVTLAGCAVMVGGAGRAQGLVAASFSPLVGHPHRDRIRLRSARKRKLCNQRLDVMTPPGGKGLRLDFGMKVGLLPVARVCPGLGSVAPEGAPIQMPW